MRLQTEGPPDATDGGLAQAGSGRQHAAGPVRYSLRSLLQCEPYHLRHLVVADIPRRSRSWLIAKTGDPLSDESISPEANGETGCVQFLSYSSVAQITGTTENDPRPETHCTATAHLRSQTR